MYVTKGEEEKELYDNLNDYYKIPNNKNNKNKCFKCFKEFIINAVMVIIPFILVIGGVILISFLV